MKKNYYAKALALTVAASMVSVPAFAAEGTDDPQAQEKAVEQDEQKGEKSAKEDEIVAEEGTKANPWNVSADDGESRVTAYLEENADNTYTLNIEGDGAMADYAVGGAPWHEYLKKNNATRDKISDIRISNGLTRIGDNAFLQASVTNVTIPDTVTSIGDNAFWNCNTIQTTIPASVQDLGTTAFFGTFNVNVAEGSPYFVSEDNGKVIYNKDKTVLWQVSQDYSDEFVIPDTVTKINDFAMYGCENVKGILTIPNSVTEICQAAFYNTGFNAVTLGNNVEKIGTSAFRDCKKMTGDFVLPESVTELGNFIVSGSAFNGKLDIKANIEEIPAYAFKDTKFTSLALPNSLKKIGEQAFYGCASLTSSITFGNKLEIVDKYAFSKSGIAGALVFPTSLKKIGTFAFAECPNITGITLPEGNATIEYAAFYKDQNVEKVMIPFSEINFDNLENGDFYFEMFETGKLHTIIVGTAPEGVSFSTMFSGSMSNLKTLVIGMGVSQISDWAISSQIENGLYPSTITIGEGNTNYTNKATKYTVTNGAISRGEEKNMLSLETPDGQACPEITYMSSDENIISIDTNGKMKAVGAVGQTATVLAKYDGTTFAQINMTIGATVVNDDAYYVNPIVGDVTYTGEGLKPAIEVYKNGTKIEDTTEYTVDYANNTNVGVATATVKVGETEIGTANFNIVRATPTITISPSVTAQRGAGTVTLTATKPEKATGAVTVKCDNGITVYEKKDGVYTAALPNATRTYTFTASYAGDSNYNAVENVTCTVDVTRKKSSSSSSDTSAPTYGVSTGKTENGEISVTPAKAEAGETVTIKATPDSGYQLDKMTVKDKNNSTVKLKKVDENEYTFTMPVGKVSVDATFVQKDAADDSNAAEAGKTIKLQIGSRIVNVDNEAVIYDAAPVIRNDRTLVPIRIITEALGGKVDWNGATKEVTLSINDKEIKMTIGKTLEKYGVAPVIIDGRTFVPVRFVADELGANVAWDDATKTVTIKTAR